VDLDLVGLGPVALRQEVPGRRRVVDLEQIRTEWVDVAGESWAVQLSSPPGAGTVTVIFSPP
jgi:hypothetical protein